jgi:NCAIR mutase (PurE)-related protein
VRIKGDKVNENYLYELLSRVKEGSCSIEEAISRLSHLSFEDLGFAKIDHHRRLRKGFPEVILGLGKRVDHIIAIAERMADKGETVLITRLSPDGFKRLRERFPEASVNELARAMAINRHDKILGKGRIGVVSAGTSDLPVAEEAAFTAEVMGNELTRIYDVGVAGIHRLFSHREELLSSRVLIVVAGMEGALPSVVAGVSSQPVIAVPTSVGYGASWGGLTALFAMLTSCSAGIAVVNIDNGFGAAYFASVINRL